MPAVSSSRHKYMVNTVAWLEGLRDHIKHMGRDAYEVIGVQSRLGAGESAGKGEASGLVETGPWSSWRPGFTWRSYGR